MGRLRLGSETLVAPRTMTARFFLGFAFSIALAAWIDRVAHIGFSLFTSLTVTLGLLPAEFLGLVRSPIFLIGHPPTPSLGPPDALL